MRKPVLDDAALAAASAGHDHAAAPPAATPGQGGDLVMGIALRVASGLLFVGMAGMIRMLSGAVPVGQLVFTRSLLVLPLLLGFMWWRRQLPRALFTHRPRAHALRSLYGVISMFATFVALGMLPLAEAQAIGFASPIFMVLLGGLLLGETITPMRWTGVGLGLAGVLLMVAPALLAGPGQAGGEQAIDGDLRLAGAGLALVGALMWALVCFQIRKLGASEEPGTIALYFACSCILASLVTLPFGWTMPAGRDLVLLLAMGLLGGAGQIVVTLAYARTEASALASFEYLPMVWAVLLGVLAFDEWPGPATLAGAAIVLSAVALVARVETRRRAPA